MKILTGGFPRRWLSMVLRTNSDCQYAPDDIRFENLRKRSLAFTPKRRCFPIKMAMHDVASSSTRKDKLDVIMPCMQHMITTSISDMPVGKTYCRHEDTAHEKMCMAVAQCQWSGFIPEPRNPVHEHSVTSPRKHHGTVCGVTM
jgi:hypothetical protein